MIHAGRAARAVRATGTAAWPGVAPRAPRHVPLIQALADRPGARDPVKRPIATLSCDQVKALQLFGELPRPVLEDIARRCRVRHFGAGEHVLHHHDTSSELFFVLEGRVRVLLYSPSGRDVSFRDLNTGEVFGELAAIDGGPRAASVVANTDATLAVMSRADFTALITSHPSVAQALLRHLVALIRRYSQRVYELSTLGVEERIRIELLRLAWEAAHGDRGVELRPAPTLADLASLAGTTREAVSREIARLTRAGLVKRNGRSLLVHDIARLSATVEDLVA